MDAKYVHEARHEMDTNLRLEREEMDKKVKQERAAVDKIIKQERQDIFRILKQVHEEMDKKLQQEREEMDNKVKEERAAMDRRMQQKRKDMDCALQLERAKVEFLNMQARVDTNRTLQHKVKDMDYKELLEQVRIEAKMMQDRVRIDTKKQRHLPSPETSPSMDQKPHQEQAEQEQNNIPLPQQHLPYYPEVVVMEFRVFKDREFSHVPKGYLEELPGFMTFTEPCAKVEWSEMVLNLCDHGYKWDSDLYYIKSGCVPPDGMVLISCQDHVDKMMQDRKGTKKCDLYIVTNGPFQYDSDNNDMSEEFEQYQDSLGYIDIGTRDSDTDGSSPRTKQPALNNSRKSLEFSSGDEHASST